MFYKKIQSNTELLTKSNAIIITSTGNKEKLLRIIENVDKDEFECYGIDNHGEFHIPIIELEKDNMGDIDISHIDSSDYAYSFKFDIDIQVLSALCEKENIPFYFDCFYSQNNCNY
jgi:hypothetical protein